MTDNISTTPSDTQTTIEDFRTGLPVEGIFRVTKRSKRLNRNGDPYLALTLSDQTGTIEARVWKNINHFEQMTAPGANVQAWGKVSSWAEELQFDIRRLQPVDGPVLNLIPEGTRSQEELAGEIDFWLSEIADPVLHQLTAAIWQGPHRQRLLRAPATVADHHDCLGGLSEHTLAVTEICQTIALRHPQINTDLAIAASLLHDIGRAFTITVDETIDADDTAELTGHVMLAHELLLDVADAAVRRTGIWSQLVHCISMHHGPYERIRTREASLLFSANQLDVRLARR